MAGRALESASDVLVAGVVALGSVAVGAASGFVRVGLASWSSCQRVCGRVFVLDKCAQQNEFVGVLPRCVLGNLQRSGPKAIIATCIHRHSNNKPTPKLLSPLGGSIGTLYVNAAISGTYWSLGVTCLPCPETGNALQET